MSLLRASGKLIDPVVEAVFRSTRSPPALWRFANWTKAHIGHGATGRVIARLSKDKEVLSDWNSPAFLAGASQDYKAVLDAVSTGSAGALRRVAPLLSESLYALVARGIEEGVAETGAVQGAEVLRELSPPELVQAREIIPVSTGGRWNTRPTHIQVAVRMHTAQQPFATPPAGAAPEGGSAGGGGRDRLRGRGAVQPPGADSATGRAGRSAAPRSGGGGDDDGYSSDGSLALELRARQEVEWTPVREAATGQTYWVQSLLGQQQHEAPAERPDDAWQQWVLARTWAAPAPAQLAQRAPFRIEHAGAVRTPVSASANGSSAAPEMHVTHTVYFERAVPPHASASLSAASARWRLIRL